MSERLELMAPPLRDLDADMIQALCEWSAMFSDLNSTTLCNTMIDKVEQAYEAFEQEAKHADKTKQETNT